MASRLRVTASALTGTVVKTHTQSAAEKNKKKTQPQIFCGIYTSVSGLFK